MNRQKKRTITFLMIGIASLCIGTLIGYLSTHFSYSSELEQKTEQIEELKQSIAEQKKENEDLQADILEAKKTITALEEKAVKAEAGTDEESQQTTNPTDKETAEDASASSSTNTDDSSEEATSEQTNATDADNQPEELASSESSRAIKLVKDYVGYANETNVHFDIEGNVPGSSDIYIHVYEVVDDGESQHTATIGWYGVNLDSQSVYDTGGL